MNLDEEHPPRADARRNRALIIAAAVTALSAGPAATVSEIASRAGVSRGTVYAHFPTRSALVEAAREASGPPPVAGDIILTIRLVFAAGRGESEAGSAAPRSR